MKKILGKIFYIYIIYIYIYICVCVCVCECISKCVLYSCVYFSPCCTECVSYPLGDSRCADRSHWSDKRTNSVYCCEDSYLRPGGGRRRSPTGQGVIMHCHCYTRDEVTLIDTGGGWRERQTDRQIDRQTDRQRGISVPGAAGAVLLLTKASSSIVAVTPEMR